MSSTNDVEDEAEVTSPRSGGAQPVNPKTKKREQNRIAQRTYRENQKKRLHALEAAVAQQTVANVSALPTRRMITPSSTVAVSPPSTSPCSSSCALGIAPYVTTDSTMAGEMDMWGSFNAQPLPFGDIFEDVNSPVQVTSPPWQASQMSTATSTAADKKARPILHRAVESGNLSMCKILLDNGVPTSKLDSFGKTALHVAVENGYEDITTFILRERDPNVRDSQGCTALFPAVEKKNEQMINTLLGSRLNLNSKDSRGETALHLAVELGFERIVELLVQHGADLSI